MTGLQPAACSSGQAHLLFRKWFDDLGFTVCDIPSATPFEGEGDALFEAEVEVISLRLVDPRFYHLDTCFCPLTGGYLMYFPTAFDAESNAKIEYHYPKECRIPVSEMDALRFACNAINVGRHILLNEISGDLSQRLEGCGFLVLQVRLTEFLKAGGAAKCLVLRLSELDATHSGAWRPRSAQSGCSFC